jgi:hypothetical protein
MPTARLARQNAVVYVRLPAHRRDRVGCIYSIFLQIGRIHSKLELDLHAREASVGGTCQCAKHPRFAADALDVK